MQPSSAREVTKGENEGRHTKTLLIAGPSVPRFTPPSHRQFRCSSSLGANDDLGAVQSFIKD